MSPEVYQENEPLARAESSEKAREIADELRETYHSTKLSGDRLELPAFSKELEIDSCSKPELGVSQQLRAVVKAGQDIFGIVEAIAQIKLQDESKPHFIDATIITRHNADGRAVIVKTITTRGNGVEPIGRSHQKGLGDEVSRNHFYIETNIDRTLNIYDGDASGKPSTNGTEVFEIKPVTGSSKPEKPWGSDFTFWAPESTDVKKKITDSIFRSI